MNWFKKFMAGRYGGDQLSVALLIFALILSLTGQLVNFPILAYLSYIPLALCIYRMFSKNINRRRMENYKFSMLISPIYPWFNKTKNRIKDSKTHKYFKCPNCKASLRLPKGKGKIVITCPKCKNELTRKT